MLYERDSFTRPCFIFWTNLVMTRVRKIILDPLNESEASKAGVLDRAPGFTKISGCWVAGCLTRFVAYPQRTEMRA